MNLLYLIRDLWQRKDLQEWVNCRFKDDRAVVLDRQEISHIVLHNRLKFCMTPDVHSATSVVWRYPVHNVMSEDRIIDLGANVGGFALHASLKSRHPIVAVEPIMYPFLKDNIQLNLMDDRIVAYENAISDVPGKWKTLDWRGCKNTSRTITLDSLIDEHGCSFLKMDIEGAEWKIDPECLHEVQVIVGQLHYDSKQHMNSRPELVKYLEDNYDISYRPTHPPKNRPCLPMYGHAPLRPLFRAYRKEPGRTHRVY